MKKIAIIEGYIRDAQIYTGDPAALDSDDQDWENHYSDLKNPCQYVGIFEGETDDIIIKQAAECEGVHPGIITLIDI